MSNLKLTIELVPQQLWYNNVRGLVSKDVWKEIKQRCYRLAGYKCEICGEKGRRWPVECHEIWYYDDHKHIQTLKGFIALCPACHLCKHPGFASTQDKFWIVVKQMIRVNGISKEEFYVHYNEESTRWIRRNKYKWTNNIDYVQEYLK